MLKRIFDLLISVIAILLLLPAGLAVACLVRIKLGRPILFSQMRVGKDGNQFKIYKFRTMLELIDKEGNHLPDEARLTRFGRFLRSSSLDELPELWNVLTGDMSLVGPRPLLVEYLSLYTPEQNRRHEVRPGITGWAQVNGRNLLGWPERFKLDLWYVDHRSFSLDIKILMMTLTKVVKREGINADNNATMPHFTGSE